MSLADFRGHPVLLHFWAVGCPSCAAEYPDFSRVVAAYAPKGVRVVAVDAWGEAPFKGRFFQAAGATTRAGGAAGPVLVSVATGQRTSQTKKPTPKRGEAPALVRQWQAGHHLSATLLIDQPQAVVRQYGVQGTPTTIFIDRTGRITGSNTGPLTYAGFQHALTGLL